MVNSINIIDDIRYMLTYRSSRRNPKVSMIPYNEMVDLFKINRKLDIELRR
jgi:hypothetical protein